MRAALTPPFVAAALVLCVAGATKLRSPYAAVQALQTAGVPRRIAGTPLVRAAALGELVLGGWGVIAPSQPGCALIAGVYAVFAGLALLLHRRRGACGCFGQAGAPASPVQSLLSAAFALTAGLSAAAPPHGAGWILSRGPGSATVLTLGIAGCAYAAVVAYTELPQAWAAWSAR